ncbi:M48 family metalloprotease [Aquipuribacter sp. MA13-6]|uniref:M48 family metalloprotease n=1 Tax=unclassified Aquipuribacter TaxID=2635084 RepID=UPI003EEF803D
MRTQPTFPTPGPVLDAMDEVALTCGVGKVAVFIPARRVAALAYTNSRGGRIVLDRDVAAAAATQPEMIRFLLAHEVGHQVRSTKSLTTLVGGGTLMALGLWLIAMASLDAADVATDLGPWLIAWTYIALVMLSVGAWALAARRDRVTELDCDDYAADVGFALTPGAAESLRQLGSGRVRLPRVMRTHPDWRTRLRHAQRRIR